MIFPKIESDLIVRVNDKLRISATKSYISKDESNISKVEIEPESGVGFIDVTGSSAVSKNWFLDWEYSTNGIKTISLKITTQISPIVIDKTITLDINSVLASDDKILSSDDDLVSIETDIMRYVPDGKSSFLYAHREARNQILEWLFTNGFLKENLSRISIDDIINVDEFKFWSKYLTLSLLNDDFSKSSDDVFSFKSKKYENDASKWRHKSILRIDLTGDGIQGLTEGINITTRGFIRE